LKLLDLQQTRDQELLREFRILHEWAVLFHQLTDLHEGIEERLFVVEKFALHQVVHFVNILLDLR
jgi:hypothetical protein